jgi:predicted DNA-binding transcriptional regulator AlpA
MAKPPPDLVNEDEAAVMVGLTPKTLQNKRANRDPDGPPYVRVSGRAVRYSRKALQSWLDSRTVTPGARQA